MAILSSEIIVRASQLLVDVNFVRWSQSELLGYLNDGQREVSVYKPNAYVTNVAVVLVAGTKQSIPTGGLTLIDVIRNMGTAGATAGSAIRLVSRGILDAQVPDWHTTTANTVVKNYVYTPLDPKRFYVYPPQPTSGMQYVEIVYGATPTAIATYGDAIIIDDIYAPALLNYVLFRAWSKDAEYAANAEMANTFYQAFTAQLVGKANAEKITAPTKGAA